MVKAFKFASKHLDGKINLPKNVLNKTFLKSKKLINLKFKKKININKKFIEKKINPLNENFY